MSTLSPQQAAFMQSLSALEAQLEHMSDALVSGDAVAFESCCEILIPQILDFSQAHKALPQAVVQSRTLKSRLRVLANSLSIQRENMARRAVGVDRHLEVLLPSSQGATYGNWAGGYGRAARAPGSFASLHA